MIRTSLALLLIALLAPGAAAQTSPRTGGRPGSPASAPAASPPRDREAPTPAADRAAPRQDDQKVEIPTELTQEPYAIPALGMSIYLPSSALVDLSRLEGGRTTVLVRPETEPASWVIQIHSSISSDHELTLGQAVDNLVDQRRQARVGQDARGNERSLVRAFDRQEDLVIGGVPSQRVFLDVPGGPDAPVSGFTVFHNGPGQFVIVQLDCTRAVFSRIRHIYELMTATVDFRDPAELGADRAAALLAGEALMRKVASADLDAALDDAPTFFRIYRPAPGGAAGDAEEIGYQRVQIRRGTSGELGPKRRAPRADRNASDSKEKAPIEKPDPDEQRGYIVRVEARTLAMGVVVDTISTFFLDESRESELWSITMVIRRGKDREEWTETGIRREQRLTVKTTRSGDEPTAADYALPRGYIARVETYLLPRLTVRAQTPGLFGFYSYESQLSKMSLRRDEFAQDEAGVWTQSTLLTENSRPMITTLDKTGRIVRRVMPDGQIMEPIDPARLRQIWADKKLPLE